MSVVKWQPSSRANYHDEGDLQYAREIPNPKSQNPNKFQAPNIKSQLSAISYWSLELGIYLDFGIWILEFFSFVFAFAPFVVKFCAAR